MANVMDYMEWRGDLSYSAAPFNDIDCFICAELSYFDYEGIADTQSARLGDAVERYLQLHPDGAGNLGVLQSKRILPMFKKIPECPRYSEILVDGFENIINEQNEEQFSAVTLMLPDGSMVISYRGTDDTIVGWKEDFNISINDSVPAQLDAVDYLIRHSAGFCGDIILTGHSKGGNLAIFAAANAPEPIKYRIRGAVSFDGPGFKEDFLASEGYKQVEGICKTVMSQHSLVGVILNTAGRRVITNSTVMGPLSHDVFHWLVNKNEFIEEQDLSVASRAYATALNTLVLGMEPADMAAFIDELFDTLNSTEADTISELLQLKNTEKLELAGKLITGKRVNGFTSDFIENLIKAFK